jgi:steroid 5-alpha reductase family enzyme
MHSLVIAVIIDAAMQYLFWAISALLHTEKLFDLSGALTYQAITIALLALRPSISFRQIIAGTFVLVWSARLGGFLFIRVLKISDKRFDELKTPVKFLIPFTLQILWVYITALAVYILLSIDDNNAFIWSDAVGIAIFVFGFLVESIADYQKYVFKNSNPQDFISTGLFRYSRYPNYFGEVVLWVGVWILCVGGFSEGWNYVSVISPVFVFCLIWFGSGVALSESNAQKRYGTRPEYQKYLKETSKFILWPPKKIQEN